MTEYALLSQVTVETKGSALAAGAIAGDLTLTIDYAGDFDGDGGTLDLNGARLAYASITEGSDADDPDVINLLDAVPDNAATDDLVAVVEGNLIAEDWWAICSMEDGDSIMVPISYDHRSSWPVGDYDPAIPVTLSDDLKTLLDAPGRTVSSRNSFRNTDVYTYDGVAASILLPLTKTPISGSEQPFWKAATVPVGGVALPPGSWHIDLPNLVVDDSGLMAEFSADDVFWVDYAWDQALDDIYVPPEPPAPFDFGYIGDLTSPAPSFPTSGGNALYVNVTQPGQVVTAPRAGTITSFTLNAPGAADGGVAHVVSGSLSGTTFTVTDVDMVTFDYVARPQTVSCSLAVNSGDYLGFYLNGGDKPVIGLYLTGVSGANLGIGSGIASPPTAGQMITLNPNADILAAFQANVT